MKYLYIEIKVLEGEFEHTHRVVHTTKCNNLDFAAEYYTAHFWGYGIRDFNDDYWWWDGGHCGRLEFWREITPDEYKFLSNLHGWSSSTSEFDKFPNGFEEWQETHYEIVSEITKWDYDEHPSKVVREHYDAWGTGGMYDLARELTDKFELEHKNKQWGIDDDTQYFDAIEEFLDRELYE